MVMPDFGLSWTLYEVDVGTFRLCRFCFPLCALVLSFFAHGGVGDCGKLPLCELPYLLVLLTLYYRRAAEMPASVRHVPINCFFAFHRMVFMSMSMCRVIALAFCLFCVFVPPYHRFRQF